jgi:NAD(P)H-hydrate epimerase
VLIVGGGDGMPGAARLAGEAALRVGAGVVKVGVAPESVMAVAAGRPELMVYGLRSAQDLAPLMGWADVVAIGPGLGQDGWARALAAACFAGDRPLIVDADALSLLAEGVERGRANWILTPHPGEAARLIGCGTAAIQADRLGALRQIVERFGAIAVLKGAGTLIGGPAQVPGICERGNPGMAAPGMGDVLTGAIAGIEAQIGDPWVAARVGVLAHAMAGDAEGRNGERGVLASEVARELRTWVNVQ